MMLKQLLPTLGIKIDPAEVERVFETAKTAIPGLVTYTHEKFDAIDQRMATMETRLDNIESTIADLSIAISQLKEVLDFEHRQKLFYDAHLAPRNEVKKDGQ